MRTKIKVKEGKKVVYGSKWYLENAELFVDLEYEQIKNQRNYYDIVDANYIAKAVKTEEKVEEKSITPDIVRNRMISKVKNK